MNLYLFPLSVLLRILLTLSLYCLSIRRFCYVLLVFTPKLFSFSYIRLLVCFRVISSNLLVEFSFVVLECSVFLYCFTLCLYLFNLPSFASTFWFISSSCIVIFLVLLFHFVPTRSRVFLCLFSFACFHSFLICVSSHYYYYYYYYSKLSRNKIELRNGKKAASPRKVTTESVRTSEA